MLTAASLDCANRLFAKLIVRPDVMFAQFDDSKGFVMAEAVMMNIAPKVGRGAAYNVIKAAIDSAPAGASFKDVIRGSPNLLDLVGESNIHQILDPRNYLGAAPALWSTRQWIRLDQASSRSGTGIKLCARFPVVGNTRRLERNALAS